MKNSKKISIYIFLGIYLFILVISAIKPYDLLTWFLESLPTFIGLGFLTATYKKFQFTIFTYFLILLHSIVLLVGAHYTYAFVPCFDFFNDLFVVARNNYDKLGHFMQGFVPAAITSELLIRLNVVSGKIFFYIYVISVSLAISAFYEIIEWLVAIVVEENSDLFLGTQGFEWDTQTDMFFALMGSLIFFLLFFKIQKYFIKNDKLPCK